LLAILLVFLYLQHPFIRYMDEMCLKEGVCLPGQEGEIKGRK